MPSSLRRLLYGIVPKGAALLESFTSLPAGDRQCRVPVVFKIWDPHSGISTSAETVTHCTVGCSFNGVAGLILKDVNFFP